LLKLRTKALDIEHIGPDGSAAADAWLRPELVS
jgi:hypothetical protein